MNDAVLVLTGIGSTRRGREVARQFYEGLGYTLFMPDYLTRVSLARCVQNVSEIVPDLTSYDRLFVFCNILGGWVFNLLMRSTTLPNLQAIIYDRSPTQELAARLILDKIPFSRFFSRWLFPMILDFESMPYPPLPADVRQQVRVGLLVETKSTRLMRVLKRLTLTFPTISFQPDNLNQPYDDILYVCLDHDDIYTRYDITGGAIQQFFQTGEF